MITLKQFAIDSFLLSFGDRRVFINPISNLLDLQENDIVLLSVKNDSFSYLTIPKLIFGAGEFEIKSIFIYGAKNKLLNSFNYLIHIDNLSFGIVHGVSNIDAVNDSIFTNIDVLLIAAGNGDETLHPRDADNLADKLTPSVSLFYGFHLDQPPLFNSIKKDRITFNEFKNYVESATAINKPLDIKDIENYKSHSDSINKLYFDYYAKI